MIALQWQDKVLSLLDQSAWPHAETWVDCATLQDACTALSNGTVQDESVAAVAGAYAYCLAAIENQEFQQTYIFDEKMADAKARILASRPGSRAMADAMAFMENPPEAYTKNVDRLTTLLATAVTYDRQQVISDRTLCRAGADLMGEGTRILVRAENGAFHGAAASGAIGIVRRGWKRSILERVTLCEGRPSGRTALLARELTKTYEIPCTLIPDHAAATFLARQGAHMVLTDGYHVAKNGDLMAPVGTYELAIACYFHSIPFYAAVYCRDVDLDIDSGAAFGTDEETCPAILSENTGSAESWTPAYDVVPAFLITGMITDRGIVSAPYEETLDTLLKHTPKKNIIRFD